MDPVELDALAAQLDTILELDRDLATEVVVTLAEHHDRRVIAPLLDLLASGRANELMVRAAGWLADPGLHRALERLAASRIGGLEVASAAMRSGTSTNATQTIRSASIGPSPSIAPPTSLAGAEQRSRFPDGPSGDRARGQP